MDNSADLWQAKGGGDIKWHLTPHQAFLPEALGAWTTMPIQINRTSPSPDLEAEFTAQPNFQAQVQSFLDEIGANWQPTERERGGPSDNSPCNGENEQQHPQEEISGPDNSPIEPGLQADEETQQGQGPVSGHLTHTDIPQRRSSSTIPLHASASGNQLSGNKDKNNYRADLHAVGNGQLTKEGPRKA